MAVVRVTCTLCCGQSGAFRQFPLLPWRRVRVVCVPLAQNIARLFFETIGRLFAVPYGPRQWELASDPILADRTQRPAPESFGFDVMSFEPKTLQFWMWWRTEVMALQYSVELFEVTPEMRVQSIIFVHISAQNVLIRRRDRTTEPLLRLQYHWPKEKRNSREDLEDLEDSFGRLLSSEMNNKERIQWNLFSRSNRIYYSFRMKTLFWIRLR